MPVDELCNSWVETKKCRYEDRCNYAHGQHELTAAAVLRYGTEFKGKNCRMFYTTKVCFFGEKCMFRHEHRSVN